MGSACHAQDPVPDGSADVRYALEWIRQAQDNSGRAFAVVDKKKARILVFNRRSELVGTSPVLLGLTPGDHGRSQVSDREVRTLGRGERSTPAGRFETEPGRNLKGEDVVWINYDAALAIHRLRPGADYHERARRMRSTETADHRASLGCVIVPGDFFDSVVKPALGQGAGVVYVLPESRSVQEMLPSLAL